MYPGVMDVRRSSSMLAVLIEPDRYADIMKAFMLPVRSGMTQEARDLAEGLRDTLAPDLEACCARLRIARMSWHLAVLPSRDFLVIHLEGADSEHFLRRLGSSRHPFELRLHAALTVIVETEPSHAPVAQLLLPLFEFAPPRGKEAD